MVDSREKHRVPFPKTFLWYHKGKKYLMSVETQAVQMETGDYALAGYEHLAVVERKGSWDEIFFEPVYVRRMAVAQGVQATPRGSKTSGCVGFSTFVKNFFKKPCNEPRPGV